jgi:hypothetical protein
LQPVMLRHSAAAERWWTSAGRPDTTLRPRTAYKRRARGCSAWPVTPGPGLRPTCRSFAGQRQRQRQRWPLGARQARLGCVRGMGCPCGPSYLLPQALQTRRYEKCTKSKSGPRFEPVRG